MSFMNPPKYCTASSMFAAAGVAVFFRNTGYNYGILRTLCNCMDNPFLNTGFSLIAMAWLKFAVDCILFLLLFMVYPNKFTVISYGALPVNKLLLLLLFRIFRL